MTKFLIIQTASIGDVILATPLIGKINHHFPDSQIDFLLKNGIESLFTDHPIINNLIIWDKSHKKHLHLLDTLNYLREEKYDYIINLQRFASTGFLTVFSKAKHTIGFKKNPFSLLFSKRIRHSLENIHEVERNLSLITHLTDDSKFPVKLYPTQNHYAKVSQYKTSQYICIAPTSLWLTKQYPEEKWIEFLNEVDKELTIYFLGSKTDYQNCDRIIKSSQHNKSLNLAGQLSFLESAALMRDAKMNFVNDSAPQHIASAMNAPVSSIFCSTIPEFGFGPLSENSKIIELKEKLSCRPCGIHGLKICPEGHFKCAKSINVEQLLERIE
ncbi:MAG: glycosyltransferase family 9 protein [Saprospiraceae bacterium]|nr:glycosyltransferase family 9 protein [Saprospiraceae bacterium]